MTDPTTVVGPTGPGGAGALSGYTGSSNEGGNYAVALAGAQFVTNAVPEPTIFASLAAGIAGLALVLHRRGQRRRRTSVPGADLHVCFSPVTARGKADPPGLPTLCG